MESLVGLFRGRNLVVLVRVVVLSGHWGQHGMRGVQTHRRVVTLYVDSRSVQNIQRYVFLKNYP
jgi:hypothetical protein